MKLILNNVNKTYGKKSVLKNVDLQIDEGEVVGLIGPNGAGKTTLMKVICGMTEMSSGKVILDDKTFENTRVIPKGKIGCLIENPTAYE